MFRIAAGLLAISVLAASHEVRAQGRTLRVVSTQGTPIPFATAWIEGGMNVCPSVSIFTSGVRPTVSPKS